MIYYRKVSSFSQRESPPLHRDHVITRQCCSYVTKLESVKSIFFHPLLWELLVPPSHWCKFEVLNLYFTKADNQFNLLSALMQCLQPSKSCCKVVKWILQIEKCPTVYLLGSPLHGLKWWYPSQEKEMVGEHEKTLFGNKKKLKASVVALLLEKLQPSSQLP